MYIQNNKEQSWIHFQEEVKRIPGTEEAIFELSREITNFIILTGTIYGKKTHDKIIALGENFGFHVLARNLNIMFVKPK